jgi:ribosomal-protein-alanine N-acetyltransferase
MNATATRRIRLMTRHDWPAVLDIEAASFPNPWTEVELHAAVTSRNVLALVAADTPNGEVLGYLLYQLRRRHLRLLNLAVAPARRRAGVGTSLVGALLARAGAGMSRRSVAAAVGERNDGGHRFLAALGFKAVRLLPGYDAHEDGSLEDAYLFLREGVGE